MKDFFDVANMDSNMYGDILLTWSQNVFSEILKAAEPIGMRFSMLLLHI